jgi:A/G-specific adenine glycosylase
LWQAAEDLLPAKRIGAFNQALMELGALVCTPVSPRCVDCPLTALCAARQLGLQESIPVRGASPAITSVRESAIVIRRADRLLLVRRPADANRWANLWEFPHGPLEGDETHEAAAVRLAANLTGLSIQPGPELHTLRHGITRYQITLVCFEADYESGEFQSDFYVEACWVEVTELRNYPVSAPQRRLADVLTTTGRQRNLF